MEQEILSKMEAAISVMQRYVELGHSLSRAYSGGKDSTCTLVLMLEAIRRAGGTAITHHIQSANRRPRDFHDRDHGGPGARTNPRGIERDMAISYLSRLVILREIAPRLGRDRPAGSTVPRVFVMGYPGGNVEADVRDLNAEKSYSKWKTHAGTVAGNEALVLDAAQRYPHALFFGLNPGFVNTNIRGNLFGTNTFLLKLMEWLLSPFTITPETYAERIVPLLVTPALERRSGLMFNNKGEADQTQPGTGCVGQDAGLDRRI